MAQHISALKIPLAITPLTKHTLTLTTILVTCAVYSLWLIYSQSNFKYRTNIVITNDNERKSASSLQLVVSPRDITIATVVCVNGSGTWYYDQTATMIKSVILSAKIHNVPKIVVHIFLEHMNMSSFFLTRFKEFGVPHDRTKFRTYFHSVINTVPEKYKAHMLYHHRYRCGYVRLYLPSALPEVDTVLYLDSDVIITGDINKLWNLLAKMNDHQMIALGRNNEPEDKNFGSLDGRLFANIPFVPPKGVNDGVMLMNLTRLRNFGWQDKITRAYQDYSKITKMEDQRLVNIVLFYSSEIYLLIPCELNSMNIHCRKGLTCNNVKDQSSAIHLIHGTNNNFRPGREFHYIFSHYNKFNLLTDDFVRDLAVPLQRVYEKHKNSTSKCFYVFSKYLFQI